ncbi:MAG: F0F1 ATP synthase subunit B' [Campylobacter sp.]|nr:F0F1 ATP synthase subunit B' [Campylobacter sp.]MBR7047568.1 F0F1 ATP synthase subunit B' [Campylobacter sp.]
MLEISLPALIFTVIVFLGLIYILNIMLYKPLLSFMDSREAMIQKDAEEAKQNALDVDSDRAEITKILDEARSQAAKIKQLSLDKAKEDSEVVIAAKKSELEADFDKFVKKLGKEKTELKKDLQDKIPEFKSSLKSALAKI